MPDASETDRKILRDVFEQGDIWFRTGDLMRKDEDGYFYFVDRIGDTFRWKGENVSTAEVAEAINSFPGIEEANVYGVRCRAATAAPAWRRSCARRSRSDGAAPTSARHLPEYARPLFLRIRKNIDVTTTFKQKKIDLVKRRLRSRPDRRPDLFQRSDRQGLRPARPRALRAHPVERARRVYAKVPA